MAKHYELFWSFFKIGTSTIGGGYAMIPLMEKELVDRRQWLGREEFMDILAVSQALPGVFAVNMATSVGYRLRGYTGAAASIVGNILMPVLIILGFATCFRFLRDNPIFEAVFKGIRPAVVALIAAPVFNMAKTAKVSWRNFWIPVVAAVLIYLLGVSPMWIVLAAIIGGLVYGRLKNGKEARR
ncbi:MAG: chromate transporter [Bacteroidales bacterium]|nr:chromate transporter [Bacteroidales bacterium]